MLAGRAWPVPRSVAEAFGLDGTVRCLLIARQGGAGPAVGIRRGVSGCLVDSIAAPLAALGAQEEDLAFFCVMQGAYTLIIRKSRELDGVDALHALLWHCGLPPADDLGGRNPWSLIARALGGGEGGRDEVRRRLEARRDRTLLALLDQIPVGLRTGHAPRWDDGWQYTRPRIPGSDLLAVVGPDLAETRLAVGVADVLGQLSGELIVTDGGLVWTTASGESDEPQALKQPPRGLIPAARRSAWSAWIRAEHALRRAGLGGTEVTLHRDGSLWRLDGTTPSTLVDAIEAIEEPGGSVEMPAERVRTPYPRAAFAFERALDDALGRGLLALTADRRSGIRADYVDGRRATGSAFLDVFAGP